MPSAAAKSAQEDQDIHERPRRSSFRDAVGEKAAGVYALAQRSVDRVVAPDSRRRAYDSASSLAASRPILFSFAILQLTFSFLPLLIFAVFAASTVAFAIGAAILFSLFWVGVALLVLVPTLLVVSSIAVLVWGWALASFLIARWLYAHVPVSVTGAVQADAAGMRLGLVKDEHGIDGKVEDKY
ncbi:hypothetical protein HIM_03434 [Hirsutella minnesotensis 3608]|uniref:Uncharacterized protein n=1 Tax=Hirsutella minnesotensis 3608 TaxID=1043627 RepID=A0A0F7ZVS3_9HYPO|nr:hypothetical protein HIM_03434 [Hirsutella minnesotensis 3608]